jgi:hypothetical protein
VKEEHRYPLFRVALLEPEEGDVYRRVAILALDPAGVEAANSGDAASVLWIGYALEAEELAYTLKRVAARGLRLDDTDTKRQHEREDAAAERARKFKEEKKGKT